MPATPKKKGRASKAQIERQKREAQRAAQLKHQRDGIAIALFASGALLIALSLHEGEGVWRAVGSVLFGVFGVLAYAVGPIVLALAVMLAYGKKPPIPRSVKVGALFVAVSGALCVFGDYRCANGKFVADIAELYRRGSLVEGGGAMSALLGWPLEVSCGLTAAKILIILIIFVCVMLLTGRTIADLMNTLRKPIDKIKNVHEEHAFAAAAESADSESDAAPWEGTPKPSLFRRKKIDIPIGPPSDESSAMGGIEENNTDFKTDETLKKEPEILASRESAVTSEPERVRCCVDEHGSRIDIPLGPEFDPSSDAPVDDDEVITRDAAPCGPAAEVVDEVFRRQQMMETLFTDFKDSADDRSASAPNTNPEPIVATPQPEPEPEFFSDVPTEYRFPPVALLDKPKAIVEHVADDEMRSTADSLVSTLKSFGVSTKIIDYSRGPTVTRYELQPEPGVRLSRIVNLSDDLALNLAADGVRIEAPIPGKAAVGVEVPNKTRSAVKLRSVIESDEFKNASSPLSFAIGKDIAGKVKIGDISKMPHLLIAGATGMGKSVCINSIIMSLVYKSSPDDVQLVLVDPKLVEFTCYAGLPHLHTPVVTDPKKAAGALGAAVAEMQKRYRLFAETSARNIEEYNAAVDRRNKSDAFSPEGEASEGVPLERKSRIVIVIDELNDLMMTAPNEVEDSICRLAQMGRAAGIHLVVATQRPSVDVITGTIKNNIPTRIAFKVSSQVDSRTILDTSGAEKLIGNGDMLFLPVGATKPVRVQGCYVGDEEVARVVEFLKKYTMARYNEQFIRDTEANAARESGQSSAGDGVSDAMLEQAIEVVIEAGQASTSLLQRKLRLGYSRAARIMDDMEEMGIITAADGSRPREVRMTRAQFQERTMNLEAPVE